MTHPTQQEQGHDTIVKDEALKVASAPRLLNFRGGRLLAFLLGLALIFNPYVLPSEAEGAPRLSDVIALILAATLLFRWVSGYRYALRFPVILWVVLGLILVWFARDAIVTGTPLSTDSIRWLLAIPYAYALYRLTARTDTRTPLILGLCLGMVANVIVLALQAAGLSELMVQVGLASGRWSSIWVVGGHEAFRATGMWGHPNASAGVVALCFPLVCGLIDEKRLRTWWILAAWGVVFTSSMLTYTRSGVLVCALIFLLWTARSLKSGRSARWKLFFLFAIAAALIVIGPPGGWWRWLNEADLTTNSAGRIDSTLAAAQLALTNPLGVGADYARQLSALTREGIEATHNAWLYLALVAGVPLTAVILFGAARRLASLFFSSSVEGWLALSLFGLFFFEEFFRVPCFVVLTLWIAIKPRR